MKAIIAAPFILVVVGVLMLFAGSAVANAEEGVANALGRFLQNKWIAAGLILAGVLWFAHDEGYLTR